MMRRIPAISFTVTNTLLAARSFTTGSGDKTNSVRRFSSPPPATGNSSGEDVKKASAAQPNSNSSAPKTAAAWEDQTLPPFGDASEFAAAAGQGGSYRTTTSATPGKPSHAAASADQCPMSACPWFASRFQTMASCQSSTTGTASTTAQNSDCPFYRFHRPEHVRQQQHAQAHQQQHQQQSGPCCPLHTVGAAGLCVAGHVLLLPFFIAATALRLLWWCAVVYSLCFVGGIAIGLIDHNNFAKAHERELWERLLGPDPKKYCSTQTSCSGACPALPAAAAATSTSAPALDQCPALSTDACTAAETGSEVNWNKVW